MGHRWEPQQGLGLWGGCTWRRRGAGENHHGAVCYLHGSRVGGGTLGAGVAVQAQTKRELALPWHRAPESIPRRVWTGPWQVDCCHSVPSGPWAALACVGGARWAAGPGKGHLQSAGEGASCLARSTALAPLLGAPPGTGRICVRPFLSTGRALLPSRCGGRREGARGSGWKIVSSVLCVREKDKRRGGLCQAP